jgi:phage/plasmid-associated DNA primase
VGKLVNVYADLPAQHLASSAIFKTITGGDPLLAERKFKESFEFRPFCRLIFSANHYPTSQDTSLAFFRRWIVLPFERSFSDHDPKRVDPTVMEARLRTPAELSGLLNLAVGVLPAFQARGRFVEGETTQGAWVEFRDQTDPLANWLDHQTVPTPTAFISRKDLRIKYANYLKVEGRPPMGEKTLYAGVRRLRPMVKEGQKMVGGTSERGFYGLGLKTDMPVQHQKQQKQEIPTCINHAQDGKGGIKEEGENKQVKLGPAAFAALPASQPEGDCTQALLPDPDEVNPWK